MNVKAWRAALPSVDGVRPPHCPNCGCASRIAGERLALHGHGVRSRQQRGPHAPGERPEITDVSLRRYRCTRCSAVCAVGPGDVVPRYLYSGPAIAWALGLFGLLNMTVCRVRRLVAPWQRVGASAHGRWTTLRRWLRAIAHGQLFRNPALGDTPGARQLAARLASVIAAQAPPEHGLRPRHDRAFFGAPAYLLATV